MTLLRGEFGGRSGAGEGRRWREREEGEQDEDLAWERWEAANGYSAKSIKGKRSRLTIEAALVATGFCGACFC